MVVEPLSTTAAAVVLNGLDDVAAEINLVAGHRNALDGRLVDVAIWLLANDGWKGTGLRKPEQFLAFRCGLSPASARRYVQVAARAEELPESIGALRRGELCLDQLMPIVRRVPAWADSQVLRLSKKLTVGQINAVINKYDFERSGPPAERHAPVIDDQAADEAELIATIDAARADASTENTSTSASASASTVPADTEHARSTMPKDRCWVGVGDDGRWRLHLETSPDVGMVIDAALREARDRAFRSTGSMVSDAEALADVANRSLDAIDDASRRDRFRINLHVRTDGVTADELGATLPDVMARHISCDGLVSPVFTEHGVPVSVGRSHRIVPDRTRRIVLLRDGGCRVPGCGATQHLEVHHVVHWADGGRTDTWNLVALCGHHHRMHHHGKLDVTGNADIAGGLTITNEHGIDVCLDGPRPEPVTGPPPAPVGKYRPPLCERLDMGYVSFIHPERLELIAASALAHSRGQPGVASRS
ncbi:HNH endonuclease signature motif containing protein [Ilumatobacter coccineus]|uniref:HNH nuclease domain-containing protein n=1 Tax=Ilumatobacter coccineus (strain NBRC 103263 / KCTC 29153 / YM16-304) TaxID=1313172 RepID=A0A6C7ECH5_ILUCY|nr:HNH endonuclease signature motif containing protein [Ilumatobacter coccineus]BAN04467.1 hypothetical protein YM304_41530 [Ilumatobacter coccineus YM16-304]